MAIHARYVVGKTVGGAKVFLIQIVSSFQGFTLLSWHNGHGAPLTSWKIVLARKVPKAVRERLGTLKAACAVILPI